MAVEMFLRDQANPEWAKMVVHDAELSLLTITVCVHTCIYNLTYIYIRMNIYLYIYIFTYTQSHEYKNTHVYNKGIGGMDISSFVRCLR